MIVCLQGGNENNPLSRLEIYLFGCLSSVLNDMNA
jgi:hypothetical protein